MAEIGNAQEVRNVSNIVGRLKNGKKIILKKAKKEVGSAGGSLASYKADGLDASLSAKMGGHNMGGQGIGGHDRLQELLKSGSSRRQEESNGVEE